jgi:hypothetical protein
MCGFALWSLTLQISVRNLLLILVHAGIQDAGVISVQPCPALSRHSSWTGRTSGIWQLVVHLVVARNGFLRNEGLLSVSRLSVGPHGSYFYIWMSLCPIPTSISLFGLCFDITTYSSDTYVYVYKPYVLCCIPQFDN